MLFMIPAVIVGTRVGRLALDKINERIFLMIFRIILLALGLKLIVVDGLALF